MSPAAAEKNFLRKGAAGRNYLCHLTLASSTGKSVSKGTSFFKFFFSSLSGFKIKDERQANADQGEVKKQLVCWKSIHSEIFYEFTQIVLILQIKTLLLILITVN